MTQATDYPVPLGMNRHVFQQIVFDLPLKYQPIKLIGKGTYGAVISAVNLQTKQLVAIKRLAHIDDLVDAKRVLREIIIMKNCVHENILSLQDVIYVPRKGRIIGDLFLVCDLMETDLNRVIRSKQNLQIDHKKFFLYQILRALKYLHSANIIHRDLKPSNILLNENCDLKICDFGLSRSISEMKSEDLTEYVVTRYYRAPEIMLSSHEYTNAVDVWSTGCSFGEVLSGKVLFPGQNYIEQIVLIINMRGTPDQHTLGLISNEYALKYVKSLPDKEKVPLDTLFPNAPPEALDLIDKLLDMNPERRITTEEALKHPFLASLHDEDDEPVFSGYFDFSFENDATLTMVKIQRLIMKEIAFYNPAYYELSMPE